MRLDESPSGLFSFGGFLYIKTTRIWEIAALGAGEWIYHNQPKLTHVDGDCNVTPMTVPLPIRSACILDLVPEWLLRCNHNRRYLQFERLAILHLQGTGWSFPRYSQVLRAGQTWYGVGGTFTTTEGDSFGPTVRILFGAISPDGTVTDIWHG